MCDYAMPCCNGTHLSKDAYTRRECDEVRADFEAHAEATAASEKSKKNRPLEAWCVCALQ